MSWLRVFIGAGRRTWAWLVPVVYPATHVSLAASIYTMLALTAHRYTAICSHTLLCRYSVPDYYFRYLHLRFLRSYLHRRSGSGYLSILIILFVSSCVNATRFLEYRSQRIGQQIIVLPTDLKLSVAYNIFMSLLNILLNTCVPLACLLFMNFKIYLAVRQRNELLPRLNMKQVRRDSYLQPI